MRPGFEVLREQFSQDRLLSEILGPDHDPVLANPSAAHQKSATDRDQENPIHTASALGWLALWCGRPARYLIAGEPPAPP